MEADDRIKMVNTFYHFIAIFIFDHLIRFHLKGLTDIGDRYSKNRITYRYLHAVNNSQSQRDLHGNRSSFTVGTGYRNDTA